MTNQKKLYKKIAAKSIHNANKIQKKQRIKARILLKLIYFI